jgi:hypothetical protein
VTRERRSDKPWTGGAEPPPPAGADVPPEAALAASAGLARALADEPHDAAPFHVPGLAAAIATDAAVDVVRTAPVTPLDETPSWLHSREDRSVDPVVCPFLRAAGADGLIMPLSTPDPANRCAALDSAVPQSLRQQELVCLSMGHVNCPRYLRGTTVVAVPAPAPVVRAGRAISPAMLASLIVLVFALTASIGFVVARNDALTVAPSASASAKVVAIVSPGIVATAAPSVAPSVAAAATAAPRPTPTPTPAPTPTPTPEPTARRTPRPTPASDRYELLQACGSRCWTYRVRRGDNLFSIANYFGVSLSSIYTRNPWLRGSGLRAGQELRLPPPTR